MQSFNLLALKLWICIKDKQLLSFEVYKVRCPFLSFDRSKVLFLHFVGTDIEDYSGGETSALLALLFLDAIRYAIIIYIGLYFGGNGPISGSIF